ncbi:MAG: hypothetical protein FJ087_22315, partial [Deltaproteobacteria bacterium]|nr:hypothetical protein [Deltaproteobacteria bacterium]
MAGQVEGDLEGLSACLGLALGFTLASAASDGRRLCLAIASDEGVLDVEVEARTDGAAYYLADERHGVRYRGESRLSPAREKLLRGLLPRLAATDLDGLLRRVPAARSPGPEAPARDDRRRPHLRLDGFYKRLDHAGEWFRMFRPERTYPDAHVRLPAGTRAVQHCTRECRFNHAVSGVASLLFFRDGGKMNPLGREVEFSFVDEQDVLAGRTVARLAETLERAAGGPGDRPPAIHLATTCLPELVGEHPGGIVREFEERTGVRVFWTSKTLGSSDSYRGWLAAALPSVPFREPRDRAVVLAGVLDERDAPELARLLAGMGLEVAGRLLPGLDVAAIPGLAGARAVVWCADASDWEGPGGDVFAPYLPSVRPPAPIGVVGTLAWVDAVAAALAPERRTIAMAQVLDDFESRLAPLRAVAARVTVALVGDAADLDAMSLPDLLGFSVSRTLGDLGFRVRLLAYVAPGDPGPDPSDGFERFGTPEELDARLADGVDLALSHFARDPRLDAHGIRGFDESVFGAGPSGAERAVRTLLGLASSR